MTASSTLDGVTLDTNLSVPSTTTLTVLDGLTLNGTLTETRSDFYNSTYVNFSRDADALRDEQRGLRPIGTACVLRSHELLPADEWWHADDRCGDHDRWSRRGWWGMARCR